MSSGGNWPPTTRNATKALRFTETGTVYRRNALRNVDHQFIPFGNGNFPKPLTGVRFCARWQRDGERVYPGAAAVQQATFSYLAHPQQMCQSHVDKDAPFRERGSFKRSFSFRNRWRNFGHAPRVSSRFAGILIGRGLDVSSGKEISF